MKTLRFVLIGVFILSVLVLSSSVPAEASTPIEVGYKDFPYPSDVGDGEVTAEKPESKLWWNDGFWWASMWSTSGDAYHIFKLNWSTQNWEDTGTALDARNKSRADALWDGSKLYVVSHIWSGNASSTSAGQRGELYRYSYSGGTYTLDSGFPVEVSGGNAEAMVVDKDSTGMLWVTYVQDKKVYVNHSVVGDDTNWVGPYVLPVGSDASVDSDDLSSVIAYDGHIGVMWSSQTSGDKIYFAAHADGDGDLAADWNSVGAYTTSGDDHINLKSLSSDSAGKVFAAVKTAKSAALLLVLVCDGDCTSASNWSAHTAYTGSTKSPTRPIMLLDTSNRDIYFFARVDDDIYYKRSDMDSISFPSGDGDPFIKSSDRINDPTSTKQNLTSTMGLVVMASSSNYYFHNCIRLAGGSSSQCLTGNPTPEVRFSTANYYISEDGAPTAEVTVNLTGSVGEAVTVDYTVTAGSATSGVDFTAVPNGTLTFPSGSTTPQTIYVPILEDIDPEPSETINLALSNVSGGGVSLGAQDTATLTILDDDAPPTINFSSATYSVLENEIQATIDVTLSNSSDTTVTVQYETAIGTAVPGDDYVAISPTTLTFNPGDPLSKSFNITLINNSVGEPDETVLLSLSNPSANASLGAPNTAILTIYDDDVPLEIAFESAAYDVIENVGMASINVTLSRPFGTAVSVNYQTLSGGTATAGSDYTAIPPTQLQFAPGEVRKSFMVLIGDDDIEELDETVLLSLSSPSANATLGAQTAATLTIFDNDKAPGITFSSPTYNISENGTSALINVKLSHAFDSTVTVKYRTSGGTASSSSDYTAIPATTMTFAPLQTSKNFSVTIHDDGTPESSETVLLSLSDPSSNAFLGTPSTATLTILDDDTVPTITFDPATYDADENGGDLAVTVKLDTAAAQIVSVTYETSDGSAEAGKDYSPAAKVLAFAPGVISQEILLTVVDDAFVEENETFNLTLKNPENGVIGTPGSAVITIIDDDLPTVSFKEESYEVGENNTMVTITAQLSRPVNGEITVDYATANGTATAGEDYEAASGQLTFDKFQTSENFTVSVLNDSKNEQDETVVLSLIGPGDALSSIGATTTLTIIDDDRPSMQFTSSSYEIHGTGTAMIEVVLSAPAEATAVVRYETSDGTASAGSDYTATSGVLFFESGTTRKTFAIPILKGASGAAGKTVNLSLSSPQMADMGARDTAVLTIMERKVLFLPLLRS